MLADGEFDLKFACRVNGFVTYNEGLAWGELRTGNVGISGVSFVPDMPIVSEVKKILTIQ